MLCCMIVWELVMSSKELTDDLKDEATLAKERKTTLFAELNNQTIEEYKAACVEYDKILSSSVENNIGYWAVGNWGYTIDPSSSAPEDEEGEDKKDEESNTRQNHKKKKDHATKEISFEQAEEEKVAGYFSPGDRNITLNTLNNKDKGKLVGLEGKENYNTFIEYYKQNPLEMNNTFFHENTHFKHFTKDGAMITYSSVSNAVKASRLTEKAATATEYLATALQYSELKKSGIENIQVITEISPDGLFETYYEQKKADVDLPPVKEWLQEKNITSLTVDGKNCSIESFLTEHKEFLNKLENPQAETDFQTFRDYMEENKFSDITLRQANKMPTDQLLNSLPGLSSALEGQDFNPNNKEQMRKIVEAASDYWDKTFSAFYDTQAFGTAQAGNWIFLHGLSWSDKLDTLKNEDKVYDKVAQKMLKNITIGKNVTIDLTDYRDLLDNRTNKSVKNLVRTMNEKEKSEKTRAHIITYDEMKEIDNYLTAKGLKNGDEKTNYMKNFLQATANRTGENKDAELLAILLKYNNSITYADNLSVVYNHDGNRVIKKGSCNYVLDATTPEKAEDYSNTKASMQTDEQLSNLQGAAKIESCQNVATGDTAAVLRNQAEKVGSTVSPTLSEESTKKEDQKTALSPSLSLGAER